MDAGTIDWPALAARCAPHVAVATLRAVARVESGGNPLAINVNGWRLERQPRDEREAQAWLRWLLARGHSVDVGLMQVNTANFQWLGLTPEEAFDPCRNVAAGASVLRQAYERIRATQPNEQAALRQALSAYNTGNPAKGFRNGYVARVEAQAVPRKNPSSLRR